MDGTSKAMEVYNKIREKSSWDEIKAILSESGGKWAECACASSSCPMYHGSVDPSIEVEFSDGSQLYIANPKEECFSRFFLVFNADETTPSRSR